MIQAVAKSLSLKFLITTLQISRRCIILDKSGHLLGKTTYQFCLTLEHQKRAWLTNSSLYLHKHHRQISIPCLHSPILEGRHSNHDFDTKIATSEGIRSFHDRLHQSASWDEHVPLIAKRFKISLLYPLLTVYSPFFIKVPPALVFPTSTGNKPSFNFCRSHEPDDVIYSTTKHQLSLDPYQITQKLEGPICHDQSSSSNHK